MNNLHELTKQLDVLTWNSRSVLNALIRSAMSAGSSDGFSVKRAGEPVKLTQQDIYKLYHFYEAWEATGFSDDSFDEIRDEMNTACPDSEGVDKAIANHAKIMWMDSSTADLSDEDWVQRVKGVSNPKWLTNTAPIPLNIRTPIYDENLSTKVYDSYETYLFPSAYYSIDTLGHSGDGVDHGAGGGNWHFHVDNEFSVDANRVLMGTQDANRASLYSVLYSSSPLHSFEGGSNSFAFRQNAFSYGSGNSAAMDNAAVLGGYNNIAVGGQSAVVGGNSNIASSSNAVIGGGQLNMIGDGVNSFVANTLNSVGGYTYAFTRTTVSDSVQTECAEQIDNECGTYMRIPNNENAETPSGFTLGGNQIFIEYDSKAPKYGNYISAGTSTDVKSCVDFKPGDLVVLFGFRVNDGMYLRPCPSVYTSVISIQILTTSGLVEMSAEPSVDNILGYVVTLGTGLSGDKVSGLGSYSIQSGFIVRRSSVNHPVLTSTDTVSGYTDISSSSCASFGYNNIACGPAQFVVGSSNTELLTPRFIVGSGSSDVTDPGFIRANSLVSAPYYTYMKSSNYVVSGVARATTAYIHGDGDDYIEARKYDEDYIVDGVEKYAGFYAYSKNRQLNKDPITRAVLRVFHEKSLLAIGDNGLVLNEPYVNASVTPKTTGTVWNELYCTNGAIAIHSGSFLNTPIHSNPEDNYWNDFYSDFVQSSTVPGEDQSVTVWGNKKVGIHGYDVLVHASTENGTISLKSSALSVRGNTRDALTAQPTDYGIEDFVLTDSRADLITDTGNFYCMKNLSNLTGNDPDIGFSIANTKYNQLHILTSSKFLNRDSGYNVYDVAQIVLPGGVTCTRADRGTDNIPHPIVMSYAVRKNISSPTDVSNSRDLNGGYIYEELAYRSDIAKQAGTLVCNNLSAPAYTTQSDAIIPSYTTDTAPLVPGVNKVAAYDRVLLSMDAADSHYHETANPVAVASGSDKYNHIIKPNSIASVAGQVTDYSPDASNRFYKYYLAGVQINPSMYMEMWDGTYTNGITYLAYGPASVRNVSSTPEIEIMRNVYRAQLDGSNTTQSLYTSKYSTGTLATTVTNLSDVWTTVIKDNNFNEILWMPLMKGVIMTIASGKLTVEFDLNLETMRDYYAIPVKQDGTSNEIIVNDSPSSGAKIKLNKYSQRIVLPVDPSVGNSLTAAYNPSSGVTCQLHGRAYYTGNNNVFITGAFSSATPGHAYNNSNAVSMTYSFNTPCLVLNMAGWDDSLWPDEHKATGWYHCMVEGVINYGG